MQGSIACITGTFVQRMRWFGCAYSTVIELCTSAGARLCKHERDRLNCLPFTSHPPPRTRLASDGGMRSKAIETRSRRLGAPVTRALAPGLSQGVLLLPPGWCGGPAFGPPTSIAFRVPSGRSNGRPGAQGAAIELPTRGHTNHTWCCSCT